MKRPFLVAGFFPVLAACSSSTGGTAAAISGTFAGQAPAAADSAAFSGASASGAFLSVLIASTNGVCAAAQDYVSTANSSRLEMIIQSFGPAAVSAILAGTYTITNGDPASDANGNALEVSADYNALNAACQPIIAGTTSVAVSGWITVLSVSATEVTGSFDLTFPSGDELTGYFRSPVCDAAATPALTPPGAGGSDAPDTATAQTCMP
jgi:hypothetical protein